MDIQQAQDLLKEVQFPITKAELVQLAEQHGKTEIMPMLQKLPEGQKFESMEQVVAKLPMGQALEGEAESELSKLL